MSNTYNNTNNANNKSIGELFASCVAFSCITNTVIGIYVILSIPSFYVIYKCIKNYSILLQLTMNQCSPLLGDWCSIYEHVGMAIVESISNNQITLKYMMNNATHNCVLTKSSVKKFVVGSIVNAYVNTNNYEICETKNHVMSYINSNYTSSFKSQVFYCAFWTLLLFIMFGGAKKINNSKNTINNNNVNVNNPV